MASAKQQVARMGSAYDRIILWAVAKLIVAESTLAPDERAFYEDEIRNWLSVREDTLQPRMVPSEDEPTT